jgi:Fuc2NAc and GlcNAc transferase
VVLWFLVLALSCKLGWLPPWIVLILATGAFLVSVIGYWDDHKSLSAKSRLLVQIIAAGFTALFGDIAHLHLFSYQAIHLGWMSFPLVLFILVWSTNLFNFMDGLDGLTGTEALYVLGAGGLLFWFKNQPESAEVAVIIWALAFAVAGFLVWNWPKARVFMGDVGSYCLGFLIALFALAGDGWYDIPIAYWIILYGTFWFDATVTVLRRLFRKERLATAHREHAYQRLHRAGFSPTQVLLAIMGLNSILVAIVFWTWFKPEYLGWGMGLSLLILSCAYIGVEKIKPMETGRNSQ